MFSRKSQHPRNGKYAGETFKSAILTRTLESSEHSSNSSTVLWSEAKAVEIVGRYHISSVAFLSDGKHVVSGGEEGKIRRWRTEDGKQVGKPMDAGSAVYNLAVSRNGKWIVGGMDNGKLAVWDAEDCRRLSGWRGHKDWVHAVDISPDGKRIASGSSDKTASVWSLSTGQRLLGPFEHDARVIAAKFSPDGRLIATATWDRSVRVYDSCDGRLLVDVPVKVTNSLNQCLWTSNNKNLFTLSTDGKINYIDVSTGTTLFSWRIHNNYQPQCIALASDGTFIAVSAGSSVSFWDTTTHKQLRSVINYTVDVVSMAVSANDDLVIGGGEAITLQNIRDVRPSSYFTDVSTLA